MYASNLVRLKIQLEDFLEKKFVKISMSRWGASMLILPYPKEPFVVYFDVSKIGLGGVLMHNGQAVAYASLQLKVHERNYPHS